MFFQRILTTFPKEESGHFLLLRVTVQLRQMTSLKRETSDEVDFFKKKINTLVDFEQNRFREGEELVSATFNYLRKK